MCTREVCFPQVGCYSIDICCDDGNECTSEYCDPDSGCVYSQVVCDNTDPCTVETCDPSLGCVAQWANISTLKRALQIECALRRGL